MGLGCSAKGGKGGGSLGRSGIVRGRRISMTRLLHGSVSLNTVHRWSQHADGKAEARQLRGGPHHQDPHDELAQTLVPSF